MARRIEVEIVGDSRQLERAFKRSEKSAASFNATITRLNRGVGPGGILGGAALAVGIKKSVDAASDLNEQISKSAVVFGDANAEVQQWATTTTRAFGISQRQALATASSFGALFRPLGLAGAQAAEQSRKLTELGADLASFYNTNVQDALDAIRSGIVGESEPLRRYGVLLSETRVQQRAMADTGKTNAKQLTAQEKALARIELIFKDTTKAQGDFARTSEGLANQTRIATANMDNLKVAIGQRLIPAVTKGISAFNEFFDVLDRATEMDRTFEQGGKLERTLVPSLAKQVTAMKKAGKTGKQILEQLRKQLGDSPIANDLITEAFTVATGSDQGRTKRRIQKATRRAAEEARKARDDEARKQRQKTKTKTRTGPTAADRNDWFDTTIARQLNRVQDLSLRKQPARLKMISDEVRARLAVTKDATRRMTLEDQLLDILRQQRQVQAQIGDQIKAANQALKDRADAIKSAVIDRLQRKQTDILNRRALADAREQLRIARQIGTPTGIEAARRGLQDAQFAARLARVENASATLSKGGQFALGGVVTINIHGVTDPDQVARKVVEVLQKRGRRTSSQTRGTGSGNATAVPTGAR